MQVWHFQKPISTTLRLKREENIWRNILHISKHCTHSILKRMFQAKYRGRLPFTDFSQRPTPFSVLNIARIANPATPRGGGRYGSSSGNPKGSKGHIGAPGGQGELLGGPQWSRGHIGECKGACMGSQTGSKKTSWGFKGDKGDIKGSQFSGSQRVCLGVPGGQCRGLKC